MFARYFTLISIVLISAPAFADDLPRTGSVCLGTGGLEYSVPVARGPPSDEQRSMMFPQVNGNPDYKNSKGPLTRHRLCEATIDSNDRTVYSIYADSPIPTGRLTCSQEYSGGAVACSPGEPRYPKKRTPSHAM
jgi:hypothetical protein